MKFIFGLALFLVLGCASQKTVTEIAGVETRSPDGKMALIFSSSRFLEMEPCGCSFNPLGGVDREWEALSLMKKNSPDRGFLQLTAGTTFIPQNGKGFKPDQKSYHLKKAEFLVESFNKLGMNAVAPSLRDISLGLGELERLRSHSNFRWLSANLYHNGKPLFDPYWVINRGTSRVLVIGVAAEASGAEGNEVEFRDPIQSVQAIVTKETNPKTLVIVMGAFSKAERKKLLAEVPGIHILLGGHLGEETFAVMQDEPTRLYVNPKNEGRVLARIDLDSVSGSGKFWNPELIPYVQKFVRQDEARLVELEVLLKKATGDELESLAAEKAKLTARVAAYTAQLHIKPQEGILYRGTLEPLSKKFAGKRNPLTQVLTQYKEAVRQIAMEGAE